MFAVCHSNKLSNSINAYLSSAALSPLISHLIPKCIRKWLLWRGTHFGAYGGDAGGSKSSGTASLASSTLASAPNWLATFCWATVGHLIAQMLVDAFSESLESGHWARAEQVAACCLLPSSREVERGAIDNTACSLTVPAAPKLQAIRFFKFFCSKSRCKRGSF